MAKLTVIRRLPATLVAVIEQMPSELCAISTWLKRNKDIAVLLMDYFDCSPERLAAEVYSWKTNHGRQVATEFI